MLATEAYPFIQLKAIRLFFSAQWWSNIARRELKLCSRIKFCSMPTLNRSIIIAHSCKLPLCLILVRLTRICIDLYSCGYHAYMFCGVKAVAYGVYQVQKNSASNWSSGMLLLLPPLSIPNRLLDQLFKPLWQNGQEADKSIRVDETHVYSGTAIISYSLY